MSLSSRRTHPARLVPPSLLRRFLKQARYCSLKLAGCPKIHTFKPNSMFSFKRPRPMNFSPTLLSTSRWVYSHKNRSFSFRNRMGNTREKSTKKSPNSNSVIGFLELLGPIPFATLSFNVFATKPPWIWGLALAQTPLIRSSTPPATVGIVLEFSLSQWTFPSESVALYWFKLPRTPQIHKNLAANRGWYPTSSSSHYVCRRPDYDWRLFQLPPFFCVTFIYSLLKIFPFC